VTASFLAYFVIPDEIIVAGRFYHLRDMPPSRAYFSGVIEGISSS
jgi:hypothetical protein